MQQALVKQQALQEFILNWNKSHKRFNFYANYIPVIERPTNISVRYSAAKYQDFLSLKKWNWLNDSIETRSHGTMYVTTNIDLFKRGIIDIAVASSNHNYREYYVVSVLKWITEEFFHKKL